MVEVKLTKRLEELRDERKWNKKTAALNLKIRYTTYLSYESGKVEPDLERLIEIANFYNVTLDNLVGNTLPKKAEKYIVPNEIKTLYDAKAFLANIEKLTIKMTDEEIIQYAQALLFFTKKR